MGVFSTQQIARSRREFLRLATGATLSSTLLDRALAASPGSRSRKVVVVTFGGGARDDETFMPDGQENIPNLLQLIPQAAFFTQVVNKGILGHYVATASIVTGVYETFNNFAAVPPKHPTVPATTLMTGA